MIEFSMTKEELFALYTQLKNQDMGGEVLNNFFVRLEQLVYKNATIQEIEELDCL